MKDELLVWVNSPATTWLPLVGLTGLLLATLLAFGLKSVIHGRPHSARVAQTGGTFLLGEFFMEWGLWVFAPFARFAVRLGLHPDTLSWTSLVLTVAAAFLLGQGAFGLGGWLLLVGSACDSLDGSVARARGLASDAGETLDAVIDRWAEIATFFGYAWYYRDDAFAFSIACAACAGSVLVSYTRAKGEGFGIDAKMGTMQRHERAAYLITATILSSIAEVIWPSAGRPRHLLVLGALALIAIFANWTGARRTAFIRAELRKR